MEATSIDLHKDTRWFQSWRSVAENNQYINRLWDWKTKYDESENPVIRTTRFFTDKLSSAFGKKNQPKFEFFLHDLNAKIRIFK